jgi:hypothetical protein
MGNKLAKRRNKLEKRRKAWDALSYDAKKGTKRPGSLNGHK